MRNTAGGGRGDKGEKGCVGCRRGAASPHGGRGGRRPREGESGAGHRRQGFAKCLSSAWQPEVTFWRGGDQGLRRGGADLERWRSVWDLEGLLPTQSIRGR